MRNYQLQSATQSRLCVSLYMPLCRPSTKLMLHRCGLSLVCWYHHSTTDGIILLHNGVDDKFIRGIMLGR
jgi:hypothetical protein